MNNSNQHKLDELSAIFYKQLLPYELAVIKTIFQSQTTDLDSENEAITYAISNGLGPLLKNSSCNISEEKAQSKIQKAYFTTLLKNTHLYSTIEWIRSLLDQNEIKYIFIKGSLLAFTRYEDSALRPMSDIDVLIESGKAIEAYKILKANGARGQDQELSVADNDHHLPSLMHINTMIEVHRTLLPVNAKFNIPLDDLFDHSCIWNKDKIALPGPDVILSAFYVATHLYYTYLRGGLRLSWFYDLKVCSGDLIGFNAEDLFSKAQKYNLLKPLTFAGTIYYCLSGEELPNWPMAEEYHLDKTEIKRVAKSFRAGTQQNTSESYQLIFEQIREARGLKSKFNIATSRLSNKGQLKGFKLINHSALVTYRMFGYLINTALKKLKLK